MTDLGWANVTVLPDALVEANPIHSCSPGVTNSGPVFSLTASEVWPSLMWLTCSSKGNSTFNPPMQLMMS